MSLMIYTIDGKDIVPVNDIKLKEDKIYIIIDIHAKRPKLWIWSGVNSSMIDKYHAGVSATKIKSRKKLYGASIEVVESGAEPEQFPNLSEAQLIEATEEEFEEKLRIVEPKIEKVTRKEPKIEEISAPQEKPAINSEMMAQTDIESKMKLKSFLSEISRDLNNIRQKIDDFIQNIEY